MKKCILILSVIVLSIPVFAQDSANTSCNSFTDSQLHYLFDKGGVTYNLEMIVDCFGIGQTLTELSDIVSVDINLEHSYAYDLDIFITAPNGVQIQLFAQAGGSTWFGEATDNDDTDTNPGIGYSYSWSMNPMYNGTMSEAMNNDNTSPVTSPNG